MSHIIIYLTFFGIMYECAARWSLWYTLRYTWQIQLQDNYNLKSSSGTQILYIIIFGIDWGKCRMYRCLSQRLCIHITSWPMEIWRFAKNLLPMSHMPQCFWFVPRWCQSLFQRRSLPYLWESCRSLVDIYMSFFYC